MVRPTDQKMITIEKTVCDMVPKKGMPHHAGHMRTHWGQSGGRRSKESMSQRKK